MTDPQIKAAAEAACSAFNRYDGIWEVLTRGERESWIRALAAGLEAAEAVAWQPIEGAPRDCDVLVWYDHAADPSQDPNNPDKLTDYATHAESGGFLDGAGWAIARWQDQFLESEDEYGNGYWIPGGWFRRGDAGEYEVACNATHYRNLPEPPK